MSAQPYFDDLHEQEDPFGYRSRWYEERKRALLLASLSQRQFARGWELGCSNGVLTEALAARCERLLATDISPRAAFQARRNLAHLPHVQVHCASHPEQWPPGRFDLIVCGEMGYYLGAGALRELRGGIDEALRDDGLLVACHWLPSFAGRASRTEVVHRCLGKACRKPSTTAMRTSCFRDGHGAPCHWPGTRACGDRRFDTRPQRGGQYRAVPAIHPGGGPSPGPRRRSSGGDGRAGCVYGCNGHHLPPTPGRQRAAGCTLRRCRPGRSRC